MENFEDKLILPLQVNDVNNLTELFKFIYSSFNIEYVEYNNKKYCNRTNIWYDRKTNVRQEILDQCDKDIECKAYFNDYADDDEDEECTTNPEIVESNKIKYFFIYKGYCESFDDNYEIINQIDSIKEFLYDGGKFNNITFICNGNIMFKNKYYSNFDHRGSNHTAIDLKCYENYGLNNKFDMIDLLNALYNIKSHKFDNKYEMFVMIENITKFDNLYILDFLFNNGN